MTSDRTLSFSPYFHELTRALPSFLARQRWFGDKAREIERVEIEDYLDVDLPLPGILAIIRVRFLDGLSSRYLFPATLLPVADNSVCEVDGNEPLWIADGLASPPFRRWLIQSLIEQSRWNMQHGDLVTNSVESRRETLAAQASHVGTYLQVEQSNSAIVFSDEVLLKVFRKLEPGINPDVELNRFLSVRAHFPRVPAFFGSVTYEPTSGEPTVVAVAQEFIAGAEDGWSYILDILKRSLTSGDIAGLTDTSRQFAGSLGSATAELHLALASDPWTSSLAPDPILMSDAEQWSASYLDMLNSVLKSLGSLDISIQDERTSSLIATFIDIAPGLKRRIEGFERLVGRTKTRVHGDYHLGQILRKPDGELFILDFEGEPQRALLERQLKTSPLKDVAGMLRSFSYARGAVTAWLNGSGHMLVSDLVTWERLMRRSFLDSYITTARAGGASFLPPANDETMAALSAWELDKATYEVLYELNNRPDWLWIPLSSMVKLGQPEE